MRISDWSSDVCSSDLDILWRNSATGANVIWKSGSTATEMAVTKVGNLEWQIVGVGAFNGDGKADILWRNTRYGKNQIWRSASSSTISALATVGSQIGSAHVCTPVTNAHLD